MCALKRDFYGRQHPHCPHRGQPCSFPFPRLKHPTNIPWPIGWDPTGRVEPFPRCKIKRHRAVSPRIWFCSQGREMCRAEDAERCDQSQEGPALPSPQSSSDAKILQQLRQIPLQLPFLPSCFSWTCSWLSFDVSSWENIFIKHNKTEKSLWESLSARWFWLVLMFFWLAVKMHLTLIDWAL